MLLREGVNPARGDVVRELGGREVVLCVTLRALAQLEAHFGVSGFEALTGRLSTIGARDVMVILQALCGEEVSGLEVTLSEAVTAIVAAFEAAA